MNLPWTVPAWPPARAHRTDLIIRGAEVIGRLPEEDRAAVMELVEASQHRAMWPGVKHALRHAEAERPPPAA